MKETCTQILELLNEVEDKTWSKIFTRLVSEVDTMEPREAKARIRSYYRGMGSFNDLVLYKNGNLCVAENQKLDKLRSKLFEQASDFH